MPGISASVQDYLEAISALSGEERMVRSIDIANRLGISRASVSRAVGVLKNLQLIRQERYGGLVLTEKGMAEASRVIERHALLKCFLVETLLVSPEIAEQDACKMEHTISDETFVKLQKFIRNRQ